MEKIKNFPFNDVVLYAKCWYERTDNVFDDIKKCIASWHEHMPDYKFINWNDSNFDWNICEFTKYCRENNLYAFCADYVRFWAIYNYGGIYLDTDVIDFLISKFGEGNVKVVEG